MSGTVGKAFGRKSSKKQPTRSKSISTRGNSIDSGVTSAFTYWSANGTTIDAAFKALASADVSEISRKTELLLYPVKKIIESLDELAQIHPFVRVSVLIFRGVVEFEIQRRENSSRCIALVLQAADMMSTLLQLKKIPNPETETVSGESVVGQLQSLTGKISGDLSDIGSAIDTYYKQHVVVKFFKSPIWADKLIALGTRLEDRKQEILFALSIRTALGVDATRLAVGSVDSKMDILMSIVKRQSAHERDLEEMVDKLGGRDLIMDDSSKFNLIAEQIIAKIKDDDDDGETSTKGSKAEGVGSLGTIELKPGMKSSAGKDITNSSLRHALKASLDTLLEENTWVYNMKLQEQTKHIRNALDASTHHILKRFDMGPHERILHPEIRALWKDMDWRYSVKARHFVAALQDHITDMLSSNLPFGARETAARNEQISSGSGGFIVESPVKSEPFLLTNSDDKWCLRYMAPEYIPAIVEAFDDDASGFIKIAEVNAFTSSIPLGWTLPQWIAYWALGWARETQIYTSKIERLLYSMLQEDSKALTANRNYVSKYLESHEIQCVTLLVRSSNRQKNLKDDLEALVHTRMKSEETRLLERLEKVRFEIDVLETLPLLCGPGRIEKYLFPLIYLVLRHQYRILRLARTEVLSDCELDAAASTLDKITDGAWQRLLRLHEMCTQQHLDVDTHFGLCANGIFEYMYDPKKCADDDDYPYPKLKKDEVQQLEDEPDLSETMLRYPLSGLDISGYLDLNLNDDLSKFGPSILSTDIFHPRALFIMAIEAALSLVRHRRRSFTWEAINERRSLRVDFLSLSHRQRWYQLSQPNADSHGHGQPVPPLTTEETERHQQIVRKISQADHNYWSSIAALQWREQVVFDGLECGSCGVMPIIGVRYNCLGCEDFNLCEGCHTGKPELNPDDHEPTHPLVRYAFAWTNKLLGRQRTRAIYVLKKLLDTMKVESARDEDDVQENTLASDDEKAPRRDYAFSCMGRCQKTDLAGLRLVCTECSPDFIQCASCGMEDNMHAQEPKTANHVYLHFDPATVSGVPESDDTDSSDARDSDEDGDFITTDGSEDSVTSDDTTSEESDGDARIASLEAQVEAMKLTMESRFAAMESLIQNLPSRIIAALGPLGATVRARQPSGNEDIA